MEKAFAFFDVDDTIISVKSMFSFYEYWCLEEMRDASALKEFQKKFEELRRSDASREELNRAYYTHFAGVPRQTVEAAALRWWNSLLMRQSAIFFEETVMRLKSHQRDGVPPVLVSGSCAPLLAPIASLLHVDHLLCAPLIIDGQDRYTGLLGTPQTIGAGKQTAIRAFLSERNVDPQCCYAYGDDISDEPMLSAVSQPVAVGDGTPLSQIAAAKGWEILSLSPPKELAEIDRSEPTQNGRLESASRSSGWALGLHSSVWDSRHR